MPMVLACPGLPWHRAHSRHRESGCDRKWRGRRGDTGGAGAEGNPGPGPSLPRPAL